MDRFGYLGLTTGNRVFIDDDGAGHDWFLDGDQSCDSQVQSEVWNCLPSTQIDLLTVTMHELGHVLGFGHLEHPWDSHDVMAPTLAPGVRHTDMVAITDLQIDTRVADSYFFQLSLGIPSEHEADHGAGTSDADLESVIALDAWLRSTANEPASHLHSSRERVLAASDSGQTDEQAVDQVFAQLTLSD